MGLGVFWDPARVRVCGARVRASRDHTLGAGPSPGPVELAVRFHAAPWYYLLTGADFADDDKPDLISVSAVVNVAGEAILYTGTLDDFFLDEDGRLDRLILEQVMRRPMTSDKSPDAPVDTDPLARFYPIDGDYFVLRYSEAITLNVEYIKLAPAGVES